MNQPLSKELAPADFNVPAVVGALHDIRKRWRAVQRRSQEPGNREFPSRDALQEIVRDLAGALFPLRLGPADLRQEDEDAYIANALASALVGLLKQVRLELAYSVRHAPETHRNPDGWAQEVVAHFAAELPRIRGSLDADIQAAYLATPSARGVDEILLFHPGVRALIHHRLANVLHKQGAVLVAKIVAGIAHAETGIEIHPGAEIGESFHIAHGTGVVIGETAVIGNRVRVDKGVALVGGQDENLRSERTDEDGRRHPWIEDDVVIYASATLVGPIRVGKGAVVGSNLSVTSSVPPGAQVR